MNLCYFRTPQLFLGTMRQIEWTAASQSRETLLSGIDYFMMDATYETLKFFKTIEPQQIVCFWTIQPSLFILIQCYKKGHLELKIELSEAFELEHRFSKRC